MPRVTRRTTKRSSPLTHTNEEPPIKISNIRKVAPKLNQKKRSKFSDDSSSESDIDNYLQKADEIDLSSSFFDTHKSQSFEVIEKNILSGVSRLSDSESEDEDKFYQKKGASSEQISHKEDYTNVKINFQQLHDYTSKIEEAKKHVQEYEAKKAKEAEVIDISSLLASGEKQPEDDSELENSEQMQTLTDSDKEDWEDVDEGVIKDKIKDLQITVALPNAMKEKKGVDLMASIKRRLNRVKKEQQIFIHKVHLLCWLAHGNFINNILNNEKILGLALSLIPSENSYPSGRPDLNYLEKILNWYKKTINLVEQKETYELPLINLMQIQISKKEANTKKMLVYIFVCILRALGIQCRLVLSFIVLPIRPPNSELCSLSTKHEDKRKPKAQNEASSSKQTAEDSQGKKEKESKVGPQKKPAKDTSKEPVRSETNLSVSLRKLRGKKTAAKPTNSNEASDKAQQKLGPNKNNKDFQPVTKKEPPKLSSSKSASKKTRNSLNQESNGARNETAEKILRKSKSEETKNKQSAKKKTAKVKLNKLRRKSDPLKEKAAKNQRNVKIAQLDGANDSGGETSSSRKPQLKNMKLKENTCPVKNHPRRLKSVAKYTETNSEDDFEEGSESSTVRKSVSSPMKKSVASQRKNNEVASTSSRQRKSPISSNNKLDVRNDIINIMKGRIKEQKHKDKNSKVKMHRTKDEDDDSDYYPEPIKKKVHDSEDEFIINSRPKVKQRIQVKPNVDRRVLSSDSEADLHLTKKGTDFWLEVFLESEEKWISVDVIKKRIHCEKELHNCASHPISYILGWNNEGHIKDVTQRYCPNWNTVTRKLRVDPKWWLETLKPFIGPKTARDKEEDEELSRQQLEQPLPNTISEYKNHPLYVLKRHLLKFEALYPPDLIPLGFVRSEAVYPRDNVYTLHSREIWVKHAKVVKPGETPYKIVKARPKYDKLSNTVITDQPLEIFGPWQVEDYVPPTAENGVVPRNAYGNVELFKACMLPKGTVHLQLTGLNRVARKMNIDCAPAVVGFDYHSGGSHPMFDGFVVCEEFSEQLVAAWWLEQEEAEKKAQEKMEKRVYDNWKKLIKGLLIRERLKKRYDFGGPSTSTEKGKTKKSGITLKKRKICSDDETQ